MINDAVITIENLQEIARSGKLRLRAFGDEWTYGYHPHHNGDLEKAADDLPRVLEAGLCRLYGDDDGLFLGPLNPKYVTEDLDLISSEDSLKDGGFLQ